VLDPVNGLMFYINSSGVVRALMDGSNRSLIVSVTNGTRLAINRNSQVVCWITSSLTTNISCSSYNGSGLVRFPIKPGYLSGLAFDSDLLYFFRRNKMDSADGQIISVSWDWAQKAGRKDREILHKAVIHSLVMFDKSGQKGSNLCKVDNAGCEQLCLMRGKSGPVCKCSYGRLKEDQKTCERHSSFIVYSRVQSLSFTSLFPGEAQNPPYPSIDSKDFVKNVIGVSCDYHTERIFYSDILMGDIVSVHFNGSGFRKIVVGQGSVEGLAYDYIHEDLYWTSYSNASISRANVALTTNFPARPQKVIQLGPNDRPRGIVVDSCDMRIYWTNWNDGRPSIQRSYLSGYGVQTIIDTKIRTPNALTIDFTTRKLYWSDARLDKIESSSLDGTNRKIVVQGRPNHPFGLVVYGDHLFWTDWILRAVVKVNKFTGGDYVLLHKNLTRQPMGIVVVANDSMKCGVSKCDVLNGGCQDRCTMTDSGAVVCECFWGRTLQMDNFTCIVNQNNCNEGEFACADGRCIAFEFTCDGHSDCTSGDDELPEYCGKIHPSYL